MKRRYHSPITSAIQRIHAANIKSDSGGISIRELFVQDRDLRSKLSRERQQQKITAYFSAPLLACVLVPD